MQSTLDESNSEEAWQEIAPVLEAAMDSLNARDRNVVVLRFFEGKSLNEVGAALGGQSEDPARHCLHHGHYRRDGFGEFNPGRAGRADQIHHRRCGHKRRDRQRHNLNPHQRSIETYGMDQGKNGGGGGIGAYINDRRYGCNRAKHQSNARKDRKPMDQKHRLFWRREPNQALAIFWSQGRSHAGSSIKISHI